MKDRLRGDLTAAMKARDQVTVRTLRMALTSVTKEEVAGSSARELSDDEVLAVLTGRLERNLHFPRSRIAREASRAALGPTK